MAVQVPVSGKLWRPATIDELLVNWGVGMLDPIVTGKQYDIRRSGVKKQAGVRQRLDAKLWPIIRDETSEEFAERGTMGSTLHARTLAKRRAPFTARREREAVIYRQESKRKKLGERTAWANWAGGIAKDLWGV